MHLTYVPCLSPSDWLGIFVSSSFFMARHRCVIPVPVCLRYLEHLAGSPLPPPLSQDFPGPAAKEEGSTRASSSDSSHIQVWESVCVCV